MIRSLLRSARFGLPMLMAVGVVALGAEPALADCSLKITNLKSVSFSGHFGRGYEVFDTDQHAEVAEVTIERRSGSCSFVVGFSAGSGTFGQRRLRAGTNILNYQLYKDAGATQVLKDIPAASSNEVFSGTLSSGQTSVTYQFAFVIPLQQVVAPATYMDSVIISVYEGTVQSAQLRDQEWVTLLARVPTVAEFGLGGNVSFDDPTPDVCVDFGELFTGAQRGVKLRARSNAGYRITMRSQNGGVMKLADPTDNSQIPYRLEIDCNPVTLGKHDATVLQQAGITTPAGREHDLQFTIGSTVNASAGSYADVIIVTMYPAR